MAGAMTLNAVTLNAAMVRTIIPAIVESEPVIPRTQAPVTGWGRAHRTGTRADPRELEVPTDLGKGMAAKGIARVPGISMHTRRGHLKSVHSKLGFPANAKRSSRPSNSA